MTSLMDTIWENISSDPLKKSLEKKYYKLKEWPNFGFSKYSPDFIVISANLTRRSMNKKEIMLLVKTDENIVNHFLNSASLLQILEVTEAKTSTKIEQQSPVSKFTMKLKKLFNFAS